MRGANRANLEILFAATASTRFGLVIRRMDCVAHRRRAAQQTFGRARSTGSTSSVSQLCRWNRRSSGLGALYSAWSIETGIGPSGCTRISRSAG